MTTERVLGEQLVQVARQMIATSFVRGTYEPQLSQGWDEAYGRFCSEAARPWSEETA